jgi:hypothetical protein
MGKMYSQINRLKKGSVKNEEIAAKKQWHFVLDEVRKITTNP